MQRLAYKGSKPILYYPPLSCLRVNACFIVSYSVVKDHLTRFLCVYYLITISLYHARYTMSSIIMHFLFVFVLKALMHVYSMYTSCKHASVLYRVIVASWCDSLM